jgi:hypothetical protein
MSYSRMAVGAHWLSDVVAGAVIGVASARQILSAHERRESQSNDQRGVRLGVDVSSQYRGLHIEYKF